MCRHLKGVLTEVAAVVLALVVERDQQSSGSKSGSSSLMSKESQRIGDLRKSVKKKI